MITKFRLAITAVVIAFVAMMAIFGSGNAAYAASGFKYYGSTYINAWNGGPDIDAYHAVTSNDYFTLINGSGPSYTALESTSGGSHTGQCIADWGNQSGNARAGLYPCGDGAPWGTNLITKVCSTNSSKVSFYDVHWQGYLAPSGLSDGSAFFLNHSGEWCYTRS